MNRKINILSENTDRTTTDVMSWLSCYDYTSYRINISYTKAIFSQIDKKLK